MRWLKFNAVGAAGMAVHLGLLAFLIRIAGLHYLLATAIAVEAAILHNYFWHRKWTWGDRGSAFSGVATLLRFNLTSGLVSLGGNLLSTGILTGAAHIDPIIANLLSIGVCSFVNFYFFDQLFHA